MKRSNFGVYQFDQGVGVVVLLCVGLFAAALLNAGLLKDWFQPSITLRILLPDSGVAGLAPGAEVQVMGTRAGEIRRIVIDPSQRMHALARIEEQMRPFIRRDSHISIRRQFGIAGTAYVDISRGDGPPLDWGYAVLTADTDRAPTDTIGQLVDELRAKLLPLMDDAQNAVVAFTALTKRALDPAGPLEQTLESAAVVTQRVQRGEGVVGRLVSDDRLGAQIQAALADTVSTVAHANGLLAELERTSKDPRIPVLIQRADALMASLQTTARNLAVVSPKFGQITNNVADTTDSLPATLLQAQSTAHELELLLGQLRHNWLLGGSAAPPPSRRAPASEVRP
jgi:phospholipid/cholesterol/gamma-HCH transport system substrate-binding protein